MVIGFRTQGLGPRALGLRLVWPTFRLVGFRFLVRSAIQ